MAAERGRRQGEDALDRWPRVLWLDQEIRSGRAPNVQGLQEQFGIKRRTAFNAIAYLRYSLEAPLVYDRRRGGYTYSDPTYALPAVFLVEGELVALLLAEQVSRQYLGTPLEQPL